MPVYVEDEGITLTLRSGATVTLIEKPLSVQAKRDAMKWGLLVNHSVKVKQKRADELSKVNEDELDTEAAEKLAGEVSDLFASLDVNEIYAHALSVRFASWDFYATKADMEANQPVPMTKDAILEQCQYPARARLIAEIVEKLRAYDEGEGKDNVVSRENSGEHFTTTPTVQ